MMALFFQFPSPHPSPPAYRQAGTGERGRVRGHQMDGIRIV